MRILQFSWLFLIPLYSIFFSIDIIPVSSQCLDDQRSLLLEMKNSLEFDLSMSTKLVMWDQSVDCCSWDGVTCDDAGRVIGLDLSSESIYGGIDNSSSLFGLQYLQSLNLAHNSFNSTEIPPGFDKLTSLTYLNLSNADFGGQIPIEISRVTRLVTLDISTTKIFYYSENFLKLENPNLAMLVRNLTELTELHLDGVDIVAQGNEWCQALSSLPNLRVLSLSGCDLSGPIDSSLVKLRSLSAIHLGHNNLEAPVPEFFANFTNLTSLNLGDSGLNGTFPKKIFQVTTLQTLDLSGNRLLQGSLPEFPQNGSLQTLVLSDTKFSGKLPDSMGNLKRLSRIELVGCNFSGSIPNSMASLTQLFYLDISSNSFTGPIPNSMARLTQLFYLDLSFNSFTGPIPSFCRSKNLTEIHLAHNDLTGSIPSTNFEGLTRLVNIDLSHNSLSGRIPLSLFASPFLQRVELSFNQFSGQLDEFPSPSSSLLEVLDLGSNNLEGPVPMSVFEIQSLELLHLSSNNFNGTIELSTIRKLGNLTDLDLSYNNLLVNESGGNSTLPSFPPKISLLSLASCKLRVFPNLRNHLDLSYLDLSDNQIQGKIPNWIWNLGNRYLSHLNLSCNFLVDLEGPFPVRSIYIGTLDLHSNMLQGQIPALAPFAYFLDYSMNNFTSVIPADIIGYIQSSAVFFSLSGNKLTGNIPESICYADKLQVIDLSNNSLNGPIPQCLVYNMMSTLTVLNLGKNNLHGPIPETFTSECGLRTLDLSGNMFEGQVPRALANCTMLEVLNLGNNQINDNFPCWLKNLSNLRVLVLRFNRLQGPIKCLDTNLSWPVLQILDLASNNLSGNLPSEYFLSWKAMMADKDGAQPKLNYLHFGDQYGSYQDKVTVIIKGLQVELVKILTIFNSIDFSSNMFQGEIPKEVGHLKSLYSLNISHNALTGQIPSSMGNLKQLESLDLSQNKLSGTIPIQFASLNFLSFLNLSYNQLVGMIPTSTQLQSFSEASFEGNKGLCGPPLNVKCKNPGGAPPMISPFEDRHSEIGTEIKWEYIGAEIGFVFGFGVVIGPLVFWKRWRKWYYKHIDRIVFKILCFQDRRRGNRGRRAGRGNRLRL